VAIALCESNLARPNSIFSTLKVAARDDRGDLPYRREHSHIGRVHDTKLTVRKGCMMWFSLSPELTCQRHTSRPYVDYVLPVVKVMINHQL
jgi:hypothetical protein